MRDRSYINMNLPRTIFSAGTKERSTKHELYEGYAVGEDGQVDVQDV